MFGKLGRIAKYAFNLIVGLYAFGFLTMFGYLTFYGADGALSSLVAASVCMLAIRLTDIKVFALGKEGLRTELERTIEEAQVTIVEFRKMAELWAGIASEHAFASTMMRGLTRGQADEYALRISGFLKEIGSKAGADQVTNVARRYWLEVYNYRVVSALMEAKQNTEWRTKITDFSKLIRSSAEWSDFVMRLDLADTVVQDAIEDLAHYERQMAHRRPENTNK